MTSEDIKVAVTRTAARLHASAAHHRLTMSGDFRVSEKNAAYLLGYSAKYLKSLRHAGTGPRFYEIGVGGSRISYKFEDLASWIEMAHKT